MPAGIVEWLERKSVDMQTEEVISWVALTNEDERSEFDKTWTESGKMF